MSEAFMYIPRPQGWAPSAQDQALFARFCQGGLHEALAKAPQTRISELATEFGVTHQDAQCAVQWMLSTELAAGRATLPHCDPVPSPIVELAQAVTDMRKTLSAALARLAVLEQWAAQ